MLSCVCRCAHLDISLLQAGHICNEVVGIADILSVHWQDDSAAEVSSSLQEDCEIS